ncbi:MAG: ABC transporter ATP-binding protein [Saccharofermentanales bacterium]
MTDQTGHEPLFRLDDVRYGDWVAFDRIVIEGGRTTFFMGDSGCGKSTMLRLLNATISPSSGLIFYRGRNLEEYDTLDLRKEVSLVRQDAFLFDETVRGNFDRFYSFRELEPPPDETVRKFLDICCMDAPSDKDCTTMSGGERQRVFASIFLSLHPKVLLLDEPTSALDGATSFRFMRNITEFCKTEGIDLVAVSHNKEIVREFAEVALVMERRPDDERRCAIKSFTI